MSHHPIHKHMHTHITKSNVKAAIKDDKAHMDYLKRDVLDDQRYHAKDKDEKQTADEKHITRLAEDVKHDEKKEGVSRRSSSPVNANVDPAEAVEAGAKNTREGAKGQGADKVKGQR